MIFGWGTEKGIPRMNEVDPALLADKQHFSDLHFVSGV